MTVLERSIESAQARCNAAKYNLENSGGNSDTLQKKANQLEVAEYILSILRRQQEKE